MSGKDMAVAGVLVALGAGLGVFLYSTSRSTPPADVGRSPLAEANAALDRLRQQQSQMTAAAAASGVVS